MTNQSTNFQLPPSIILMCDLMAALPEHTQLRNATLKLLADREGESHILSITKQVVRLNPTAKVNGIKLMRSIFNTALRDTKLLWEVGASLQGADTRPRLVPLKVE